MSAAIDFYFDFALPYGYIMSQHIDAIAARHGHEVVWLAMLLGPAFKVSGAVPVLGIPVKGEVRLQHRAA